MAIWQIEDSFAAALIRSESESGRVEMWTTRRLPFEPKGALLEARNHIRRELKKLVANSETSLDAQYISAHTGFVDTESVLLYNVGPSAFALASRFGLRFTRQFAEPPATPNGESVWRHYHSYSLVPRLALDHSFSSIARFRIHLPKLSLSLKVHDYWWAAKESLASVENYFNSLSGPYSMTMEIDGPAFHGNYAALVKPLFDGVISSLHHDPTVESTDPVSNRIAGKLNVTPVQVAEYLGESANSVLGSRKVVSPYRQFVKWNPQDELCLVGQLLVQHRDSSSWTIDVAVSPFHQSRPGRW